MAVSNYQPNTCKYKLGKLDNVVYLIDEESLRDIRIDNGEAYINDIAQAPLELLVYNIALQDTSSLNERYVFTHSLTFSKNGYASHRDLHGKYYAIVKTVDNEYWLVNPMMPCKVGYTYTLDGTQSKTDFTLSTASNLPTLRVHGMSKNKSYECGYVYCKVKSLKLNEVAFSIVNGNHVYYTNQGFNEIDFNKNSLSFSESFDGDNISHSINFKIDFSAYKDSWHYNLLEFTRNKYAAILTTTCGQTILTGFHFGYQPSFTVTANDDDLMDSIEINLSDNHDNGNLIGIYDTITESADTSVTWVNTSEYNGFECIGLYTAKYLLKKELDAYGNPTNRYMCLEGYESRFPDLEIVDTFDEIETFTNYSCSNYCEYSTNMPSQIVFYNASCKQFTLTSDSDWTLTSNQLYTTVSPSSGVGGSAYTITVCNTANPQQSSLKSKLTLSFCDKSITFDVTVTQSQGCLPLSDTYSVGIQGGELTIPTNCCIQSVSASCCVSNIQIYDGYVTMYVDANTTTDTVYIPLVFQKCDGSAINAVIIQAHAYTRWQYLGRQCHDNQWCIVDRMYSGETSDSINIPTNVLRYRDCESSSICNPSVLYKWENMNPSTDYYCNNCETSTLYKWENMNPSTDYYCNNCDIQPQYRWIDLDPAVDYYCSGTTKYYKQQQQISTDGGNVWENVSPPQYRRGESAQTQSSDCGYIPTIEYRWIDLDPAVDYYCSGTTKYYKEKKQYSLDSGVTWIDVTPAEYQWGASAETESEDCGYIEPQYRTLTTATTCVGYDKYTLAEYQVSYDGGVTWETTGTSATTLIEADSEDCGYVPSEPIYEWRRITPISGDSSTFVCESCEAPQYRTLSTATTCVGVDKYTLEEYQVSYDGGVTWQTTGTSATTLIEAYSEDCGYVPMQRTTSGTPYCSGETGYDKYVDVYSQVSYDGGSTWVTTATTPTLVEADSEDCGYIPPFDGKFSASYSGGETYSAACDGNTTLTSGETRPRGYQPSGMTNAVIGDCINSIGARAFFSLINGINQFGVSLTSVTIPNSVTSIGGEAFRECSGLTSVTIPDSVTSIGLGAFEDCTNLTSITIPSGVTSIEYDLFYGCTSLTSVTIPSGVTNIGIGAFHSCSSLPNIIIPDSVTTIGERAFNLCSGLTSVTIPNSVTYIDDYTFNNCSGLTSVTIGNGVTSIDYGAFRRCTSLTSVTIPNSVTSIGEYVFSSCTSLISVTVEAITPPTLGNQAFDNTNNCPIYVPCSSVDAYKSAWSAYASRIQGIPPCS